MTVVTVRRSQLEAFRQCPLKHKLQWIDRWRPDSDSPASELGTDWHRVMAWHYGRIWGVQQSGTAEPRAERLHEEVAERIDLVWAQSDPERWEKLRWMYDDYVEKWGTDPQWLIQAVEVTQGIFLLDENFKETRFRFEWTTDLRVVDLSLSGEPQIVIDHKSTKQPLGRADIDLDDQYGSYTMAERAAHHPVLMQVANQVKTEKLKRPMTLQERFVRINGYRTDRELRAIELDLLGVAEAAFPERPTRLYSSPDPRQCGWKCDYTSAHLALRKGALGMDRIPTLMRAHGFVQRDAPSGVNP
jgi:PD-(D/E)XK nuclease superfamily